MTPRPLSIVLAALAIYLVPGGLLPAASGVSLAGARPLAAQDAPLVVTSDWLAQNLTTPNLVILHIGNEMSFQQGRIPGARLLPQQSFAPTVDGMSTEMPEAAALREALETVGISSGSRIVIYTATQPPQLAARLYITLEHFGLGGRASLLDGGLQVWREEGRAVETGAVAAASPRGSLPELRPGGALLADADYVSLRLLDGTATIMDARDPQFWTGEQQNQQNPRPGRITGAVNLPFRSLVDASGRFLPPAEIDRLFTEAGVAAGASVVTYCHVGQQASLLFFGARLTGRDARLYDGSFQEWSATPNLPVSTGQ